MPAYKEEIFKTLQDARVPAAPIRTVDELSNDTHLNSVVLRDHGTPCRG